MRARNIDFGTIEAGRTMSDRCRQTSYTPNRYVFINDFNPYQLSLSNCHVHLTLDNNNGIECNDHDNAGDMDSQ